jgi:hypothetical protein
MTSSHKCAVYCKMPTRGSLQKSAFDSDVFASREAASAISDPESTRETTYRRKQDPYVIERDRGHNRIRRGGRAEGARDRNVAR